SRCRLLGRRLDPFHKFRRWRPPWTFPERLPDDLLARKSATFPRQPVRLDDGPVQVHDPGEERALVEECAELRIGFRGGSRQLTFALLGLALQADIAHDLRRADDISRVVLDWRNRERDEDAPAVAAHPFRFEMLDPLPCLEAGDDAVFLRDVLRRDDERDVTSHRRLWRIT